MQPCMNRKGYKLRVVLTKRNFLCAYSHNVTTLTSGSLKEPVLSLILGKTMIPPTPSNNLIQCKAVVYSKVLEALKKMGYQQQALELIYFMSWTFLKTPILLYHTC